jgi:hypothetical protein
MAKFLQKIYETPNKIDKVLNSDFMQTGLVLSRGIDALKPTDPNLTEEDKKKQGLKNILVSGLGSAAINFLPKLAGFKQGGQAVKQKVKLMPVLSEPVYMNLGGVATRKQMAHNNQLFKLGGDVKGKLDKIALKQDTIPALLQVGEIVIPRRISTTKKFKNHLKKNYKYNPKKGKFIV